MQKDTMIVEMIFFCNKEDCCKAKQDIFHLILGITIQEQCCFFPTAVSSSVAIITRPEPNGD